MFDFYGFHLGEYPSPMDGMGYPLRLCSNSCLPHQWRPRWPWRSSPLRVAVVAKAEPMGTPFDVGKLHNP